MRFSQNNPYSEERGREESNLQYLFEGDAIKQRLALFKKRRFFHLKYLKGMLLKRGLASQQRAFLVSFYDVFEGYIRG